MEKDEYIAVFSAFFLTLISLALIFLFAFQQKPLAGYTQLYLVEGSYDSKIDHGFVVFSFIIENHEGEDMNYSISYTLAGQRIGAEEIMIEKQGLKQLDKTLSIPFTQISLPAKLEIEAKNRAQKGFKVWFWIRKAEYD